jgi:hypothetical protein
MGEEREVTSMKDTFTVTDIINLSKEYTLNSKDNTLWVGVQGWGDTVDMWCDTWSCWNEEEFITQDLYPLCIDTDECEVVKSYPENTPLRFHGYKVYLQFTLSLPPNRKRGDTYTAKEIREMIVSSDGWGDDIPKGGFTTYGNRDWDGNLEEEETLM